MEPKPGTGRFHGVGLGHENPYRSSQDLGGGFIS